MIGEMQSLLDGYWKWLKDQTSLRAVDDWIEITTPYLDRHNDCIQIYARRSEHGYLLTDDGYVLEDLEQSGCTIDHPRYRALVDTTLNGFGVRISEGALEVEASRATFGVRKHNLLQAMMAVEDISYIAKPSDAERPPFLDVVSGWLDEWKVRYTPNVSLMGRSGYGHRFEFVIPKSVAKPERVVRAFNRPNRTAAMNMAFSWVDTRRARSDDSTAYAILNDERPVADEVLVAMGAYGVRPVRWSDRDAAREELARDGGSRMIRAPVKPELLRWARHRAGLGRSEFPARMADELGADSLKLPRATRGRVLAEPEQPVRFLHRFRTGRATARARSARPMTEIHDSQPPSSDAVGSQMTPAHDGRPVILVVDDEADKLERSLALALDEAAELVVRHPNEVESEDVARAHLVLVDYLLNDWPERRGLPAVFRIRTGLALATVLREVADESSNGHLTAVALHTGHLKSVSGLVRPPHSHHVVARLNNLEWAFEKSDAARTRGAVQLARAAQRLEGDWPADASASEARLRDLLSLGDGVGWTERAWDHVRECQPPVHKLGGGRHGVLVLRWLLHQILPYPCFLSDVNWVAARLRISVDDLDRLLSSECELARDLEGLKYTGLMAGFLGDRWWRAAMEDYAWELRGRSSGRPEQFEHRLSEKAGEELELVAPRDPVVCLDQDLQPVGTASPEEAVRLRPDYWPPFADAAWMRIDDVRNDPALGAMVEPLDDYRVEVD